MMKTFHKTPDLREVFNKGPELNVPPQKKTSDLWPLVIICGTIIGVTLIVAYIKNQEIKIIPNENEQDTAD